MPDIKFPWPINIKASGRVNGTDFNINGAGVIRTFGVYDAILNFDRLPVGFDATTLAPLVVSNCCGAGASMRNGGLNMSTMGVEEYKVHRKLDIGDGRVDMKGKALYTHEALILDIKIEGDVSLPDDLSGHSVYVKKVYPSGEGEMLGVGTASLFRFNGDEVKVGINTRYQVKPSPLPHPLIAPEYRLATADAERYGLSCHVRIHSIFDGINSMNSVESMTCSI